MAAIVVGDSVRLPLPGRPLATVIAIEGTAAQVQIQRLAVPCQSRDVMWFPLDQLKPERQVSLPFGRERDEDP